MNVLRFWFGTTFRARARAYVGVAVLLALLGGLSLASLAGARRTASAYPRFRDAGRALDVQFFHSEDPKAARRLPGVTGSATYWSFLGGPVDDDGRPDLSGPSVELVGSLDGLHFTRDRFRVVEGRMPDASRADEVAINEHLAAVGLGIGDRIPLGIFDPALEDVVFSDTPPPPVDRIDVTVVGVGLFPDEVAQDDTDRLGRVLFTPAFTARERRWVSYGWTGVSLEGGAAGVEDFKRDYLATLGAEGGTSFRERSVVVARTQQAVRPFAVALGAFGAMAFLASVLLVGQALVRTLQADREDLSTMRAMGTDPRTLAALPLPGLALAIAAGVAGAMAVAVAMSPLAPIGPVRRVEADPGIAADWTVLLLGAVALTVLLLGIGPAPGAGGAAGGGRRRPRSPAAGRSAPPPRGAAPSSRRRPRVPPRPGGRGRSGRGAHVGAGPGRARGRGGGRRRPGGVAGVRHQPPVVGRPPAAVRVGLGPHRPRRVGLRRDRRRPGRRRPRPRPRRQRVVGGVLPVDRAGRDAGARRRPGGRRRRHPPARLRAAGGRTR